MKKYQALTLFFIIFLFSAVTSAFNVDSLLLKSVGGPKALQSIKEMKSMTMSGTVRMNNFEGRFQHYFVLPNKLYTKIELPGLSTTQIYDGENAYQIDFNGHASKLHGSEKASILNSVYFESYSYLLSENKGDYEYINDTLIAGDTYHIVQFYPFDNDTVTAFYESKTAQERINITREGMLEIITFNDDFRKVNNIVGPFYTRTGAKQVNFEMLFVLDTVEFNVEVDSSLFVVQEEQPVDFHFPDTVHSVTIPIEYSGGHIKLPVTINGKKKVTMILDSGASANIFNSQILNDLNLEVVGEIPSAGIAGFENVKLVKSDSVQIGDLTLYNQVAGSLDLSFIRQIIKADEDFGGLLGYDFLSRFPVMIDYKNHQMTVFNPNGFEAPAGGVEIPFFLTMQIPTVSAKVNGQEGNFIVDLGNALGLMLHKPFVEKNKLMESIERYS